MQIYILHSANQIEKVGLAMDLFYASYGFDGTEIAVFESASARDQWMSYEDEFTLTFGDAYTRIDEMRRALSYQEIVKILGGQDILQEELNHRIQDEFNDQMYWISVKINFYPVES